MSERDPSEPSLVSTAVQRTLSLRASMTVALLVCAVGALPLPRAALRSTVAQAQDQAPEKPKSAKRTEAAAKAPVIELLTPRIGVDEAYARARAKVRVVLYTAQWCGICGQARRYLTQRGINFVEHDVEREMVARKRHRALNPSGSVPTIEVDALVLAGFSTRALEKLLDAATRARLAEPDSSGPKTFEVRWDQPRR